jgi:phosphatidylethanolamine/phosphatidyl-N-methylethanolamine N-methyltransferase
MIAELTQMLADTALFFGLWLRKPLQIAAICPSSAPVGAAMARLIDPVRPGPVLELGSGTGTITRGLVAAGWPPHRIIAYERESQLLDILRSEIRGVTAVLGDAADLENQLRRLSIDRPRGRGIEPADQVVFACGTGRGAAALLRATGA